METITAEVWDRTLEQLKDTVDAESFYVASTYKVFFLQR